MAFGFQVDTLSGIQNVDDLRSLRQFATISVSGGFTTGPLPSGCTSSNSIPLLTDVVGNAPFVRFIGSNYEYFPARNGTTSAIINVMRFT